MERGLGFLNQFSREQMHTSASISNTAQPGHTYNYWPQAAVENNFVVSCQQANNSFGTDSPSEIGAGHGKYFSREGQPYGSIRQRTQPNFWAPVTIATSSSLSQDMSALQSQGNVGTKEAACVSTSLVFDLSPGPNSQLQKQVEKVCENVTSCEPDGKTGFDQTIADESQPNAKELDACMGYKISACESEQAGKGLAISCKNSNDCTSAKSELSSLQGRELSSDSTDKEANSSSKKSVGFSVNTLDADSLVTSVLDSLASEKEMPEKLKMPHPCMYCELAFMHPSSLREHLRTHTGERPFKCMECNATFKRNGHLKAHMRKHTGDRPYVCRTCNSSFTRSDHLAAHVRSHSGIKPYMCRECGATFTTSSYLKVHVNSHSITAHNKPYSCAQCKSSFTHASTYRTHMRTHTGEKPYKCCECQAAFIQSGSLRKHMRIHTGERPYSCRVCEATFTQSSSLYTHMKIHLGGRKFSCEICSATFSAGSTLTRHMQSHFDNTTLICKNCDAHFPTNGELRLHLSSRSCNEKSGMCDVCGAFFVQASSLLLHKRTHHGGVFRRKRKAKQTDAKQETKQDLSNQTLDVKVDQKTKSNVRKSRKPGRVSSFDPCSPNTSSTHLSGGCVGAEWVKQEEATLNDQGKQPRTEFDSESDTAREQQSRTESDTAHEQHQTKSDAAREQCQTQHSSFKDLHLKSQSGSDYHPCQVTQIEKGDVDDCNRQHGHHMSNHVLSQKSDLKRHHLSFESNQDSQLDADPNAGQKSSLWKNKSQISLEEEENINDSTDSDADENVQSGLEQIRDSCTEEDAENDSIDDHFDSDQDVELHSDEDCSTELAIVS